MYLHKFNEFGFLLNYTNDDASFRERNELIIDSDGVKVFEKGELHKYRDFYLQIQQFSHSEIEKVHITNDGGNYPIHMQIELTDYCNLTCDYCYRCAVNKKSEARFIDWLKLKKGLSELIQFGLLEISITGGEPTFHPYFEEILDFSLKNFELIEVMTNGTNYKVLDKVLAQIDIEYLNKLNISIGLNSWLKNYESINNKKHCIFQTIDVCHKYRPIRVGLVDFKYDRQKAQHVIHVLKGKNVKDLSFEVAYPIGRAANVIKIKDYLDASLELKFQEINHKEVKDNNELDKPHSCDLLLKHTVLDPLGNVRPCALFPLDQTFGNLFTNGAEVFRNRHLANLLTLPSPCKQICGNCAYLPYCQGCVYKGFFSNKDNKINCKYPEYLKSMNYLKLFKG